MYCFLIECNSNLNLFRNITRLQLVTSTSEVYSYSKVSVYNLLSSLSTTPPSPAHPPVTQFRVSASTQVSKCHSVVSELIYLSPNRCHVLNIALLLDLWYFMVLLILDLRFLEILPWVKDRKEYGSSMPALYNYSRNLSEIYYRFL